MTVNDEICAYHVLEPTPSDVASSRRIASHGINAILAGDETLETDSRRQRKDRISHTRTCPGIPSPVTGVPCPSSQLPGQHKPPQEHKDAIDVRMPLPAASTMREKRCIQTRGLTTLLNASMNCSFTVSDKRTTAHVTTTPRLASCPLLMTHADRRSPRTLSSRFPPYFSTLSCPLSKPVDYLPLHQQRAIHAILDSLIGFVTSGNLHECAMCFEHSHGMKVDDTLCARCHKEACCPFLLVRTLTDIHALPVYRTACIATTANTTPTPARSRRNFTTSSTTSLRVRWRRCCAASPPVASSCG
ncbi:hypothetical protein BJV77DRAFT_610645 [Russula vinacea]|nr:hypothetical protein BJV77DRAFT_610645 [Russula vinacea]